jgi:long-chain acyl-CoA synthetase
VNLASLVDPHPDDAVALISRGRTTSYAQLRQQVDGLRGGLTTLGLGPGDRIGVSCGNNGHFVVSYLAALGAGLVVVPLNPASPAPEVEREVASTGARAVIVGPSGRGSVSGLDRSHVPSLEFVIATDPGDAELGAGSAPLYDELLVSPPGPFAERGTGDLAVLMFTSGTAGSPKAAMLTHGNLLANLEQLQASQGRSQTAADVVFGVLPLFHIFGLNVVLGMCLAVGSPLLLIERFDPVSALEAIERHRVTIVSGPPTMWAAWAALPGVDAKAFAGVRLAASGAAKLPNEVAEIFHDRLGLVLAEGYGLTEASPVVTSAAGVETRRGSIGVPLPGVDVRLVDADGEDVLLGDPGEIWVSGPNVFPGYWEDEEATRAVLTPDGWLRTGDIAVVDDDGFLYLVDRAKDLVIVSGFNVFPAEVEDALLEHPAVEAAAVVGVAHPHTGEAVKAYVVIAPGRAVEEDDLIAFCAERLARYKCPSKVMFVEELPQGLGGKILRRALG